MTSQNKSELFQVQNQWLLHFTGATKISCQEMNSFQPLKNARPCARFVFLEAWARKTAKPKTHLGSLSEGYLHSLEPGILLKWSSHKFVYITNNRINLWKEATSGFDFTLPVAVVCLGGDVRAQHLETQSTNKGRRIVLLNFLLAHCPNVEIIILDFKQTGLSWMLRTVWDFSQCINKTAVKNMEEWNWRRLNLPRIVCSLLGGVVFDFWPLSPSFVFLLVWLSLHQRSVNSTIALETGA